MRPLLVAIAAAALALTGCKQGEGERCESTADCASGLICTSTKPGTCVSEVITYDAFVVDANVDGGPTDASVDAAPDAAPDAMPDAN